MKRSGFTLLELMVASAISLGVIGGGVVVTTQLQRRGVLESRTAMTQSTLRNLQDLIAPDLARAGGGTGTGRITFGSSERYAIDVKSNEAFASDSTFALPPSPYLTGGPNLTSDFVEIWSGDAASTLSVVRCPSNKVKTGNFICTSAAWPSSMVGKNAFAVNPSKRRACIFEVKSVTGGPSAFAVKVDDAHGVAAGPALSLCSSTFELSPDPNVTGFWDSDELVLMPASSRAFRVNWKSGSPALEVDPDGTAESGGTWQVLSRNVEQMKVRYGLVNLASPSATLDWYPDTTAGNLALDACPNDGTTSPPVGCTIPGASSFSTAADETTIRDALMHRVRNVEVSFTARSGAPDIAQVAKSGTAFLLDAESNRRDGYKRRTFAIRVSPRNFGYLRN